MQASFLLILASALAHASASVLNWSPNFSGAPLLARVPQTDDTTPNLPPQCDSRCAAYQSELTTCANESIDVDEQDRCACTSSTRNDFINCLQCAVSADPSTLSSTQAFADEAVQDCSAAGSPISPIKLSVGKNGGTSLTFGRRELAFGTAMLAVASFFGL